MKTILTLSSKGQLTLPVSARRIMHLQTGDSLLLTLDPERNEAILTKSPSIDELSKKLSSYIKPGTKPVIDVDEYYQKHRIRDIR